MCTEVSLSTPPGGPWCWCRTPWGWRQCWEPSRPWRCRSGRRGATRWGSCLCLSCRSRSPPCCGCPLWSSWWCRCRRRYQQSPAGKEGWTITSSKVCQVPLDTPVCLNLRFFFHSIIFSFPEQLYKSSCLYVGWLVCVSFTFVKKWLLEYHIVTKTYIPSNLFDSSDSRDSSDSSNRCDGCDSSDRSDQKAFLLLRKNQIKCD